MTPQSFRLLWTHRTGVRVRSTCTRVSWRRAKAVRGYVLPDMSSGIGAERPGKMDIVRFSVPGTLLYRDVVLRVVASACRLGRTRAQGTQGPSHRRRAEDFDDKVVSAV